MTWTNAHNVMMGEGRDKIQSCTYIMIPNYVKNKLRHKLEGLILK